MLIAIHVCILFYLCGIIMVILTPYTVIYVMLQCAVWTWFLANDFQFFIAAPFLIGLIYR